MGISNVMSGSTKEENSQRAKLHTEQMKIKYGKQIEESSEKSIIWNGNSDCCFQVNPSKIRVNYSEKDKVQNSPSITIMNCNTTDAIFSINEDNIDVLNFASYKNPGGRFLDGSMAQEEAICHDSNLFNILLKHQIDYYFENVNIYGLNYSLYTDRAIYTPGVIFEKNDSTKSVNVVTCAAPNFGPGLRYKNITKEKNSDVLERRTRFLANVSESSNPDPNVIILGAWGCGVFKQDFKEVFPLMLKYFTKTKYKELVFALTDKSMVDYANEYIKG